jgi:hypothetical protein
MCFKRWYRCMKDFQHFLLLLDNQFLRAFAKLWKAAITFIISVSPFSWNNSALTVQIFMKFDIWVYFLKICQENWSFNIWEE